MVTFKAPCQSLASRVGELTDPVGLSTGPVLWAGELSRLPAGRLWATAVPEGCPHSCGQRLLSTSGREKSPGQTTFPGAHCGESRGCIYPGKGKAFSRVNEAEAVTGAPSDRGPALLPSNTQGDYSWGKHKVLSLRIVATALHDAPCPGA